MFLHSAAGLHSHEYNIDRRSNSSNSIPSRKSLSRPGFQVSSRRASSYTTQPPIVQPTRSRPASIEIPRPNENTVRFREPESDTMSEDGRSVANSEGSGTTVGGSRRRRRSTRSSTTFYLAHPAPTLTQKQRLLQIRPKILLQYQRSKTGARPKPALDVVPSTLVVPRLTKRFPRMFRGKTQLGVNDVMVLKSEDYDIHDTNSDETDSDEEGFARRDLVAVICQMRRDEGGSYGRAEIVLGDGTTWTATPLSNGLQEFVTVDERGHKVTARWVRRPVARNVRDQQEPMEPRFTFSIIDPNSRRHPIMASMTQNKLEIPDSYTSVSASAGRYPPTSPMRTPSGGSESTYVEEEPQAERTSYNIDDMMKTLIEVTGIWVALRQGWSPYFRYSDLTTCNTGSASSRGRMRSLSLTRDPTRPSPSLGTRSSTPESNPAPAKDKVRRACTVMASPMSSSPSPHFERGALPTRSPSAGTAFMQRAASRRIGNSPTINSESEGDSMRHTTKAYDTNGDYINAGAIPSPMSDSPSLQLPGPAPLHPETPTRPQRRVQSVFIPQTLRHGQMDHQAPPRYSSEQPHGKHFPPHFDFKFRTGRWRAFVNLFRRNTHTE